MNSLIDVARQEGSLIELCGVLAAERAGNEPVSSAILAVRRWLIDGRVTHDIDLQFQARRWPVVEIERRSTSRSGASCVGGGFVGGVLFFFQRPPFKKIILAGLSDNSHRGRVDVRIAGAIVIMVAFELKEDMWYPTRLFKNIYWLMGISLYWPIFALIVKRLHDYGQGRAFAWLFAIMSALYKILHATGPEIVTMVTLAIFVTVLAMLGCVKGTSSPNEYGPDPSTGRR